MFEAEECGCIHNIYLVAQNKTSAEGVVSLITSSRRVCVVLFYFFHLLLLLLKLQPMLIRKRLQ